MRLTPVCRLQFLNGYIMSRRRKYEIAADRKRQKDLLPEGSGVKIAELAGVSENAVCNYWNGAGNNSRIRKAISQLLDGEIISQEQINKKMDKLEQLKLENKK